MKLAIIIAALLPFAATPQTVGVHLTSVHLRATPEQNNDNHGLYIKTDRLTVGAYRNTIRRTSVYAGWNFHLTENADAMLGGVSGYKIDRTYRACTESDRAKGWTRCWDQEGFSHSEIAPMLVLSYKLPAVQGISPRLSFMPGIKGASPVVHLSAEF